MAAVQSLAYQPNRRKLEETKFGYVYYDANALDYNQWEFRCNLKMDIATDEKVGEVMAQIIECLSGNASTIAMNIGNKDLLAKDKSGYE